MGAVVPVLNWPSAYPGPGLDPEQELAMLKSESERLKSVLETVEKRLQELETESK